MKSLSIFLFFSIFIIITESAKAVTLETANQAVAKFEMIARPTKTSNPFEKWTYDIAGFTAEYCWSKATNNSQVPKSLQIKPTAWGTFSYPEDNEVEALCESIAKEGINPVCTNSSLWVANQKRSGKWSLDYLEAPKDYSKIKIEGGLYCYLNSNQIQKQFYTANITTEWTQQPHQQSIMTKNGSKTVNLGNIMIKDKFAKGLDGKQYQEPRMVIIEE